MAGRGFRSERPASDTFLWQKVRYRDNRGVHYSSGWNDRLAFRFRLSGLRSECDSAIDGHIGLVSGSVVDQATPAAIRGQSLHVSVAPVERRLARIKDV